MKFSFAVLLLLSLLIIQQADAARVKLRWSAKKLTASFPRGGGRSIDSRGKVLRVCSGDVVNFSWSGEKMGLFIFDQGPNKGEAHYNSCNRSQLNFAKNIRPSGSFDTKGNKSGWRYYAYVTNSEDGGRVRGNSVCKQKIKVYWSENC